MTAESTHLDAPTPEAHLALGNWFMVRFIKGKWKTWEKKLADRLAPELKILPMRDACSWDSRIQQKDIATSR
ncbi:hypothetical protein P12x_003557 [Tundrisphaera lichenicola]|uniref:hypothetical protein n=1 Tax=Tundrisphaera lichenicola TaxID=2029860 RepID=UPI003EB9E411